MGIILTIFLVLLLVPITLILLLTWIITKKKIVGKIIGIIWLGIFVLIIGFEIIKWATDKTILEKEDYYGEYIINRNYYPGKQADWQYNHFRFKIDKNDSIYFYETNNEKIINTYRGSIKTTDANQYISKRIVINMNRPTHHIMDSNPTTYRSSWNFNLVFYSSKFNNVYFKKGKWRPIKEY